MFHLNNIVYTTELSIQKRLEKIIKVSHRNSHTDVAQVTESVLNDVGVLFPVKDGSQESAAISAGFPPSHGGLGRVDDGGDQTGDNVGHKQSSSQLDRHSQGGQNYSHTCR